MRVGLRFPPLRGRRPVVAHPEAGFRFPLFEVLEGEWGEPVVQYRFKASEDALLLPYVVWRETKEKCGTGLLLFTSSFEPLKPDERLVLYRDEVYEVGVDVYFLSHLPCPDLSCLLAASILTDEKGRGVIEVTLLNLFGGSGGQYNVEEVAARLIERIGGLLEGQARWHALNRREEERIRTHALLFSRLEYAPHVINAPALLARAGEEYFLLTNITAPIMRKRIAAVELLALKGTLGWRNVWDGVLTPSPRDPVFNLSIPARIFVAKAPLKDYAVYLVRCNPLRIKKLEENVTQEAVEKYRKPDDYVYQINLCL